MAVRMGRVDGIEATRRIVASGSPARVIVLTTYDVDEYVFAALRAGASGFMLKDMRPGELAEAIRIVAPGDALLAPTVTRSGGPGGYVVASRSIPADATRLTAGSVWRLRSNSGGV